MLKKSFGLVEAQLARTNEGKGYLVGASVTVADLSLWEISDLLKTLYPDFLSKYPNVGGWYGRVAARPNIASYVASGKRHPISF